MILLSESSGSPRGDVPSVYKYQPGNEVVKEVMDCYSAEWKIASPHGIPARTGKIIGIYGTVSADEQLLFSLAYGQILAEKERVLFVDLQPRSGFACFAGGSARGDLGDLLFLYRGGQSDLSLRLPGMTGRIGDLEYVPPSASAEDIGEVSGDEWMGFVTALAASSSCGALIMSLGDAVRGLPGVMGSCSARILISGRDPLSAKRRILFEDELGRDAGVNTTVVTPPEAPEYSGGRGYLETLKESALGEYIRKRL